VKDGFDRRAASRKSEEKSMVRKRSNNGADVETLEPPTEGLLDTAGEEIAVEPGDTLDIRALHEIKIPQLLKIAKDLEVENATGMRKQDLIFKVLPSTTISRAPTTSMFRRRRSASSIYAPGIPCPDRSALRKRGSGTSR
jgi:hypothetical protein